MKVFNSLILLLGMLGFVSFATLGYAATYGLNIDLTQVKQVADAAVQMAASINNTY